MRKNCRPACDWTTQDVTPIHTPRTLQQCLDKAPFFRRTCVTLALGAGMALSGINSFSMGLGRVTVQSALGEPLRAQIEITELTNDEAGSLQVRLAGGDMYKASGIDFNPVLNGLKIVTERRADGRAFLRVSSDRVINDPFVDLIIETQWASGRLVRDYTLLFDPPQNRPSSTQSLASGAGGAAVVTAQLPAVSVPTPSLTAQTTAQPTKSPQRAEVTPTSDRSTRPAPTDNKPAASTSNGQRVAVQPGDTAGSIARSVKPAEVSLDQMLVALLQSNPDAFIGSNVNRLKSGSVLTIPNSEQIASASTASSARSRILAQSQDFNAFRRKLADVAPVDRPTPDQRQVTGKVEAQTTDNKPVSPTPDKLTLSKSTSTGLDSAAAKSEELIKKQASTRTAELNKNIAELNKAAALAGIPTSTPATVGAAGAPTPPVAASGSPSASSGLGIGIPAAAVPASTPTGPVATQPAHVTPATEPQLAPAPASAPAVASAPSAEPVASTPVAVPPTTSVAPSAPVQPEPSFLDELLDNPLLPAAAIALLGALGALGWARIKKGKTQPGSGDSSFLDSKLQPDSFFGASGGQNIDTNESGSSILYSPSQLDAAGDVDPVAEADVYLAYGRDLQAEEILKESLRMYPGRLPVMVKLAEIYAKRRDVKALEVLAGEAFAITRGNGVEWQKVTEYGQSVDASNPLYKPGGEPAAKSAPTHDSADKVARELLAPSTIPQPARPELDRSPLAMDLDLDLDFSSEPTGEQPSIASPVALAEPTIAMRAMAPVAQQANSPSAASAATTAPASDSPDLEFDLPAFSPSPAPQVAAAPIVQPADDHLLDFDFDSSFPSASTPQQATANTSMTSHAEPAPVHPSAELAVTAIEFDLGDLSLDLGSPADSSTELAFDLEIESIAGESSPPAMGNDPLATADANGWSTKLELAEEFHAIGDDEGARGLAEEVFSMASGDLKRKAGHLLSQLN
jgi:pilus assembly protein FimV